MNPVIAIVAHWLHLVSAITALGGTIFLRMVVHPAAQKLEGDVALEFDRTVRRKVSLLIRHSIALLLITGMINIARVFADGVPPSPYLPLLLTKIILAFALFAIAVALLIPSAALEKFQARRPFWLTINVFIGLTVVLLSAWIRLLPPE
ncbi:hypothetical protein IIC65_00510 [Candidatus Sumerlaeota bacterium]|nr:hypothetical protein [Candidatus Sumerlaeota bacterium]